MVTSQKSQVNGFTLIEMVIYVAVVALVFVIVVNTIILVSFAWGRARVDRNIVNQGGGALERMLREIRLADSVDAGASTLGAHPGWLRLNTVVSASDDTPTTRELFLTPPSGSTASTTLMMAEGVLPDRELTTGIEITNLEFYHIDIGDTSEAVTIRMTVEDGVGRFHKSKNLYGTAVLRRSY